MKKILSGVDAPVKAAFVTGFGSQGIGAGGFYSSFSRILGLGKIGFFTIGTLEKPHFHKITKSGRAHGSYTDFLLSAYRPLGVIRTAQDKPR